MTPTGSVWEARSPPPAPRMTIPTPRRWRLLRTVSSSWRATGVTPTTGLSTRSTCSATTMRAAPWAGNSSLRPQDHLARVRPMSPRRPMAAMSSSSQIPISTSPATMILASSCNALPLTTVRSAGPFRSTRSSGSRNSTHAWRRRRMAAMWWSTSPTSPMISAFPLRPASTPSGLMVRVTGWARSSSSTRSSSAPSSIPM